MTDNTTITSFFSAPANPKEVKKNALLIMDEVDGMSTGDRGGAKELGHLIDKSKVIIGTIYIYF